jgi:hypothetical protein
MSFAERVRHHFVPSKENAYRPHVLRRQWLMFFVAVIFISEGMFASSLFAIQGGATIEAPTTVAAVGSASALSNANTFMQNVGRQFMRIAVESRPVVPWVLSLVALVVISALFFTFFTHIQIQQSEMLFSGALVAVFALPLF